MARVTMDNEATPDITIDEAVPLVGGLRTWPQRKQTSLNTLDNIRKNNNLKADIKNEIKRTTKNIALKGIFERLLQTTRNTDADFNIHVYSQSPYISRRDSYEIARGSHVYRCKK
jgi:hypothetical protein